MQAICLEEKQKNGPFRVLLIIETGLADGLDVQGEGVKGIKLQIFGWIK